MGRDVMHEARLGWYLHVAEEEGGVAAGILLYMRAIRAWPSRSAAHVYEREAYEYARIAAHYALLLPSQAVPDGCEG